MPHTHFYIHFNKGRIPTFLYIINRLACILIIFFSLLSVLLHTLLELPSPILKDTSVSEDQHAEGITKIRSPFRLIAVTFFASGSKATIFYTSYV